MYKLRTSKIFIAIFRDKMINYPFINLQKRIKIGFKIGSLKLLQIYIKTDGKPV